MSGYRINIIKDDECSLKHYGILGQKWGVRRFQNEDGTYTEAGKQRYSQNEKIKNKLVSTFKDKYESDVKAYKKALDVYNSFDEKKELANFKKLNPHLTEDANKNLVETFRQFFSNQAYQAWSDVLYSKWALDAMSKIEVNGIDSESKFLKKAKKIVDNAIHQQIEVTSDGNGYVTIK